MPHDTVLSRRDGGLLTLTLNRPDTGNLLDAGMAASIVAALQALDEDVRVVCLRGAGADFCAGRESPTPPKGGPVPSAEQLRLRVAAPALALYDALKACPLPTVAVVQGRAIGVGTALACVCDITVAAQDAQFQVPEMERDIPPTLVMAALIDRVPPKTLAHLVLTRLGLDGRAAQAAGLVTTAVPADQLEAAATAVLAPMLDRSPVALRAVKQYLQLAPGMGPTAASGFAGHLAATALSARY
ncbi:enoyl-CoA hydratase/isomerase family protein [Aquabacterium sp. J223]|uniref:enoyl-CoA hydratase/isomerase family protein n=1 Tax=Aquabacterium sp. J223 TaxID=2898431 RepID=UPI0021ADC8C3|nr:enoyl-CoA hydratase/isomerase family protein [Aquabacterium sp. J223]UUX94995.1 enoyl-CoA hydratase/isomerase family protein [Aquabacterium sp. J223]